MSVKATTAVWEQSMATGTTKLVLLAIADHADPVGLAWPSVARLGRMCRITPRNIQKHLLSLESLGELRREMNAGRRGTNRYQILLDFAENFKNSEADYPLSNSSPCRFRHPVGEGQEGVSLPTPTPVDSDPLPLSIPTPEPPRTTKNREREPSRETPPPSPSDDFDSGCRTVTRLDKIFPDALTAFSKKEARLVVEESFSLSALTDEDWRALRCWFVEADEKARGQKVWPRSREEFLVNLGEAVEKVRLWWKAKGAEWRAEEQDKTRKRAARKTSANEPDECGMTKGEALKFLRSLEGGGK